MWIIISLKIEKLNVKSLVLSYKFLLKQAFIFIQKTSLKAIVN